MSHWVRQGLGLAALIGIGGFVYWWLGLVGFVAFGFGVSATILSLGLASGYWVGMTDDADNMVTDLMAWRRNKKSANRDRTTE